MKHCASDGFMMLVVVTVMSFLCAIATGLWYTMSLQADVMYERECFIKNSIIVEQVMSQALSFIKNNGEAFFSARIRRRLPLSFTLHSDEQADNQKIFSVTVQECKKQNRWPTLLVTVQLLKKGACLVCVRCLCSQLQSGIAAKDKQMEYVVHHYTLGTIL